MVCLRNICVDTLNKGDTEDNNNNNNNNNNKQKVQVKAQRIRRYEKRETQYSQNKMFKEDTKNFTET